MNPNYLERIRAIVRGEYIGVYGDVPKRFDDKTRIFADLDAGRLNSAFIAEWGGRIAKRLNLSSLVIAGNDDLTVGELVEMLAVS
jgi:hypothetical protein